MKRRDLFILIAIILSTIALYYLFIKQNNFWLVLRHSLDSKYLMKTLRANPEQDIYILPLLLILTTVIPGVPVAFIAIMSGVLMGKKLGLLINLVGLATGNILVQLFAKKINRDLKLQNKVTKEFTARVHRMKHPIIGLIIGYSIPIIPTFLVSVTASKMNFSKSQLMLITSACTFPTAFIYAYGGDELIKAHLSHVAIDIIVLLLMVVVGLYFLWKETKRKRRLKKRS